MADNETKKCIEFIAKMEALVRNRNLGELSKLRRLLGRERCNKYTSDLTGNVFEAAIIVSPLFAFWYQGKEGIVSFKGNIGNSLALFAREQSEPGKIEETKERIEKRFNVLLESHREDLSINLRRIVSILKSKDIAINWLWLLWDIVKWDDDDQSVQRIWAKSFWATLTEKEKIEKAIE